MRRVLPLLATFGLAGCADGAEDAAGPAEPAGRSLAVVRVSDGDTVVLAELGRTRLIGVDAPELGDCFGTTAKARLARLLADGRLVVRPGQERRDRYGRPLVYAALPDGRPLAELLVARGWARPLVIPPNDEGAERRARLASRARSEKRGLWGRC